MPLRPLGLGDFLSLPMKAISFNRKVVLGGPLLCVIATLLAVGLAVAVFVAEQADYFRYFPYGNLGPMSGGTILIIIIAALVYIGAELAAKALVIPGVSKGILGERITLGKAWAAARPRVFQILLLYLIIGLMAIAAILAIAGLWAAGAGVFSVLLILAAIPGMLFVAVLVGVAVTAIVLERISATAALSRAASLMRGSAWRLIGNYFVIAIVVGIVSQAISTALNVILESLGFAGVSTTTLLILAVITAWISLLIQTLIQYSFLGAVFTLIYVDLRIRTEGFDVDLARAAEAAAGR